MPRLTRPIDPQVINPAYIPPGFIPPRPNTEPATDVESTGVVVHTDQEPSANALIASDGQSPVALPERFNFDSNLIDLSSTRQQVRLIQTQSDEIVEGNGHYVPGCKVGDLLLDSRKVGGKDKEMLFYAHTREWNTAIEFAAADGRYVGEVPWTFYETQKHLTRGGPCYRVPQDDTSGFVAPGNIVGERHVYEILQFEGDDATEGYWFNPATIRLAKSGLRCSHDLRTILQILSRRHNLVHPCVFEVRATTRMINAKKGNFYTWQFDPTGRTIRDLDSQMLREFLTLLPGELLPMITQFMTGKQAANGEVSA